VTDPGRAVFLSYASQDAEAAQKICEALRAGGIEVFLDQSELRGGDVWDQKIRRQIHDCALFIPVISASTASRREGYFRLEWDLADQRSHMMARDSAFIVPVSLDAAPGAGTDVPESFHRVQWTRLPAGETPPAFVERIKRLLSPELSPMSAVSGAAPALREPVHATRRSRPVLAAIVALVVLVALAYFVADKFWILKHLTPSAAAFAPPPHSIAVLPFVNMSGDRNQEYFSDGLTEEILNSLARINELQVSARTSSFSFKGKDTDLSTIAHRLNVASILEGSVRRSAHTIRVTAQLNNAITGFHLWSQTYDREVSDVLALQTEIANSVASALKVTLLGDVAARIEAGGTHDSAALDAYLRAARASLDSRTSEDTEAAITEYTEAISLDPKYALAYAARAQAFVSVALNWDTTESAIHISLNSAQADAKKAIALAPDLGDAHLSLAQVYEGLLEFTSASEEYNRALTLASGNVEILRYYATFEALMRHAQPALMAAHRAVTLDPLDPHSHYLLGWTLTFLRQYREAIAALKDSLVLRPDEPYANAFLGINHYLLGDFQEARSFCERDTKSFVAQRCLAVTYDKLGRHPDAEAALAKISKRAVQASEIYAQWGEADRALEWLETAMRRRDPHLEAVKATPLLDPLRKEPRFQAIERELKFPN
jgi:TolB-like protein